MLKATVIKAPAGLGKTQGLVKAAAASAGIYEFYVPTHALADEIRQSISRINAAKRVTAINGRSSLDTNNQPLCARSKEAEQLSARGFPVYPNLCWHQGKNGTPATQCPHFNSCAYIAQYQPADVYIYTHAHLSLERSALETWRPSVVVIDEAFHNSCIEKPAFNIALLAHPGLPLEAKALCNDLSAFIRAGAWLSVESRVLAAQSSTPNEYRAARNALRNHTPIVVPNSTFSNLASFQAHVQAHVNFAPVATLLKHLQHFQPNGSKPNSIEYDPTTGMLTIYDRKDITRFGHDSSAQPEIKILDATASPEIVAQFFDVKFKELAAKRNATVTQCTSTRCSKRSLTPSENPSAKSKADAQRRLRDINNLIADRSAGKRKVLVIGPQKIVGDANKSMPSLLKIPPHCYVGHFNAIRGKDLWKDAEVVIVIGRNQPPAQVVEDNAKALFFDDPNPLVLTGRFDSVKRGYSVTNSALQCGVDVEVHADPRVQAVVEQMRESETTQALDRLRLVHSPTTKELILLSNLPVDVDVDELRTWDELMNGVRLEGAWAAMASHGVLPLAPDWLATQFPKLWQSPAAAKQDVDKTLKKYGTPNKISIRSSILFKFRYKKRGQRQWSACLSVGGGAAAVERKLSLLLGEPITVRTVP